MTSFITAEHPEPTSLEHDTHRLRLISGTSNTALAKEIANYMGITNVPLVSKRFADGELYVQIQQSIRGCDVFLIQPTCAPVNDSLMELMIMVDACKRASARQITAVICLADALLQASTMIISSIKLSLTGAQVGCIRKTSHPLIDCWICT